MKKSIVLFVMALFIMAGFSSCDKNGQPVVPGGGNDDGNEHGLLWKYNMGDGMSVQDVIPAIDENGNIYVSATSGLESGGLIVALDKDGNEKWTSDIQGAVVSRVVYYQGKVYVPTTTPCTVACLNASDGQSVWVKNFTDEYDFDYDVSIAIANNKIYCGSGQYFEAYLMALDFDGNEIWMKRLFGDHPAISMTVNGTKIFFSDNAYIYRYDDAGTEADSVWTWKIPSGSGRSLLAMYDLPVDANGNIYFHYMENIYVLSAEGSLVTTVSLGAEAENNISTLTITPDNEIIVGNGKLVKYTSAGEKVWESDAGALVPAPNFTDAATIAQNGNLYSGQLFGMFCINKNGELEWNLGLTNEDYGNLHIPVITPDGNIISISDNFEVRCFKGDGSPLANGGWPKPFGDYGNTSSVQ